MRASERLLVAVTLLIGLLNLLILAASHGPRAIGAASSWIADVTAERLVLTAGGDDNDVVTLSARDGRVAWGEDAVSRAHSTAFADVYRVLDAVMTSSTYEDRRTELREEYDDRMSAVQAEYEAFVEANRDIGPDHPAYEEAANRFQALVERRDSLNAEANNAFARLVGLQIEEAYREIVEAVEVVSDRRDIDLVVRFVPTRKAFEGNTPEAARRAVSVRTALRYPDGLDITDAVLEEMALSDP